MCPIKYLVKPGFQKRASMVLGWLKRRLTAAAHRNGLLSTYFYASIFIFFLAENRNGQIVDLKQEIVIGERVSI